MTPLALASWLSLAQVYSWTDKSGEEHFTDDLKAVPRGVKVRTTEGAELTRIEGARPAVPPVNPAPPAPTPADESAREDLWRRRFREARGKVATLEEDIESDRKKVEEVNGMPVNARFNCQTTSYPQFVTINGVTSTVTLNGAGQLVPGVAVGTSVTSTTSAGPALAPCVFSFNPEFERVRERLEKNRRELVRAKEELADLERRASFEAVPQQWRR